MSYIVQQIEESRVSFGSYRYRILKDGIEIAVFSHDYRGECEGLLLSSTGRMEAIPFGMCSEFLTGGGAQPTGLSDAATSYLDSISVSSR
ncbi:MAG TPA: hypothetical protein VG734_05495 [Lacunisphaera sp.]|nr:hypothetical protein [Lacunisphaera sp.]